jgi:hypothetical protein
VQLPKNPSARATSGQGPASAGQHRSTDIAPLPTLDVPLELEETEFPLAETLDPIAVEEPIADEVIAAAEATADELESVAPFPPVPTVVVMTVALEAELPPPAPWFRVSARPHETFAMAATLRPRVSRRKSRARKAGLSKLIVVASGATLRIVSPAPLGRTRSLRMAEEMRASGETSAIGAITLDEVPLAFRASVFVEEPFHKAGAARLNEWARGHLVQ